jgi:hypothetical protein
MKIEYINRLIQITESLREEAESILVESNHVHLLGKIERLSGYIQALELISSKVENVPTVNIEDTFDCNTVEPIKKTHAYGFDADCSDVAKKILTDAFSPGGTCLHSIPPCAGCKRIFGYE